MNNLIAKLLFVLSIALIGIGVFQMTERWRQPSTAKVHANFQIPSDLVSDAEYELPLTIRNDNRSEIKIVGEYRC